ncbi:MAG: tol-pal system protein YbgF [Desulfovibrio sp.]|uniref:tol-pal system protein YbgF n=1 Tax=Desulfovibrio sp. 7SRBS1 TaxID=3378064 RepID=UPI003B409AD0
MKITRIFLLLFVAAFALQGCVVSQEDYLALQQQVSDQETTQRQLTQQVAQLNEQLVRSENELKKSIESSSSPVRSTQANLWAEIEQIKVRLATLQGELDALTIKAEKSTGFEDNATVALREMSGTVDAMRVALESQLALEITPLSPGDTQVQPSAAPAPAKTSEKQVSQPADPAKALYDRALTLFRQREYGKAQALWADMVREYPKHDYVSNAIFWQGECFYQMKDYARAVLAYQEVIEKYKHSTKYASSLLKQGISFARLGKKKAGKLILEDLIKKFPKSSEAKRAQAVLKNW